MSRVADGRAEFGRLGQLRVLPQGSLDGLQRVFSPAKLLERFCQAKVDFGLDFLERYRMEESFQSLFQIAFGQGYFPESEMRLSRIFVLDEFLAKSTPRFVRLLKLQIDLADEGVNLRLARLLGFGAEKMFQRFFEFTFCEQHLPQQQGAVPFGDSLQRLFNQRTSFRWLLKSQVATGHSDGKTGRLGKTTETVFKKF